MESLRRDAADERIFDTLGVASRRELLYPLFRVARIAHCYRKIMRSIRAIDASVIRCSIHHTIRRYGRIIVIKYIISRLYIVIIRISLNARNSDNNAID